MGSMTVSETVRYSILLELSVKESHPILVSDRMSLKASRQAPVNLSLSLLSVCNPLYLLVQVKYCREMCVVTETCQEFTDARSNKEGMNKLSY